MYINEYITEYYFDGAGWNILYFLHGDGEVPCSICCVVEAPHVAPCNERRTFRVPVCVSTSTAPIYALLFQLESTFQVLHTCMLQSATCRSLMFCLIRFKTEFPTVSFYFLFSFFLKWQPARHIRKMKPGCAGSRLAVHPLA
jgi:hypothetical protein